MQGINRVIQEDLENIYQKKLDWNQLNYSTFLITGAYGMLASYVVYFLIFLVEEKGMHINIICQGRSEEKMQNRFGEYTKRAYFRACYDLLTEPIKIAEQADYILHGAGIANPEYYKTMPVEVEEPNVIGTYHLLNYARKSNVKGFLFFSSGDVYGTMKEQGVDITEDMYGAVNPLDLHSCYGESKRMGETFCSSFAREYGVPAKIARIGHTYGPTMDIEDDPRVFASFTKNIINKEDIVMLSDGSAFRPFCYIVDAVFAFFLILLKGKEGDAYNVCNTKQFISIAELADILVGLYPERNLKVVKKQRNVEEKYLEASFNKANKPVERKLCELGWKCEYSVEDGFRRVIDAIEQKFIYEGNKISDT